MSRIASGVPRQCTIALLSNGDRFRTVWSTPIDGLRLEKRSDRWEPIWEDRKVHWIRAVVARMRGSVIPFDTFDWRQFRREHDGSADPCCCRSCCGSAGRRSSRRWRGFGLFESQGRDYSPMSIVNWNHFETRPFKDTIRMFVSVKLFLASNSFLCTINIDLPLRDFEALVISEHDLRISAM